MTGVVQSFHQRSSLLRLCLLVFVECLSLPQSSLVISRLIAMLLVFKVFSYINAGRIKVLWAPSGKKINPFKKLQHLTFWSFSNTHTLLEAKGKQFYCLLLFFPATSLNLFLKNIFLFYVKKKIILQLEYLY